MDEVEREVYFQDVKLQMDAKLWGEEYSRHNPPKKVTWSKIDRAHLFKAVLASSLVVKMLTVLQIHRYFADKIRVAFANCKCPLCNLNTLRNVLMVFGRM